MSDKTFNTWILLLDCAEISLLPRGAKKKKKLKNEFKCIVHGAIHGFFMYWRLNRVKVRTGGV